MAKKYFIWKDPACNGKDNRKDNGTPVQSTVRANLVSPQAMRAALSERQLG